MSRTRTTRRPRVVGAAALALALILGLVMLQGGGSAQEGGLNMDPASPAPLGAAVPPEVSNNPDDWPVPMQNYAAHRAAPNSAIDTTTVNELGVAWAFPLDATGPFGPVTSVPLVVGETVYLQDMQSNVFALDRTTGEVRWEKRYDVPSNGPNGVAIGYDLIYGTLGNTAEAFALDAATGTEVWRIQLSANPGIGIDMAPTVYDSVVYVSTVPGTTENFYQGGTKGILYALDAGTGRPLWEFDTTTDNLWGNPRLNSGGGLWYPPSVDEQGNIYFGVGNAAPWPGTEEYPNGSSRPGDNDYASSMVSLDPTTGAVRWSHNARPHDLFDFDFQLTPILATVSIDGADTPVAIGGGKTGTVVAVNAETGEVLWDIEVGQHNGNDRLQEIPEGETVEVLTGPLGGVETPLAYAGGVVYAPVINLAGRFTATSFDLESFDYAKGSGELVAIDAATGSIKWSAEMPTIPLGGALVANDVVFTAGLDGVVRGFDAATGQEVWTYQAAAGINAPLAAAGDLLLVPAGSFLILPAGTEAPVTAEPRNELIALRIGGTGAPAGDASPAVTATEPPAATATPADGQAVTAATVELVDVAFVPAEVTIPANTDATITLSNSGAAPHNFSIDALGMDVDVPAGETATATINAPPGDYELSCDVPGHRQAGMVGTLHVR